MSFDISPGWTMVQLPKVPIHVNFCFGVRRMDTFSNWFHNASINRTLDRLGTHVDPSARLALLKFLIAQEAKLGDGPDQLDHTARRIREGNARIDRTLAIMEGLIDHGLMDQAQFSKAWAVLSTLNDSQVLLEQLYRQMSEIVSLETRPL